MLSAAEVDHLLSKLCVDLGFCLPPDAVARLQRAPPPDADSFTDAVFFAEGLRPEMTDKGLRKQVRTIVADAFDRHGTK
jgi:hypothetical protein